MQNFTGCSGFYYNEWKGIFYPEEIKKKDWFAYYCTRFNTIEINSSFYRTPTSKTLDKWHAESPASFLFSVKAPRLVTHFKKLAGCNELVKDFCELMHQGLREKLGCILYQMPPSFVYNQQTLELVLAAVDTSFTNVVEFRHKSWWQPEVYEQLHERNIIFCGASFPGNLPDEPVINNTIIYYRFHGKPVLYKSLYKMADLVMVRNKLSKNVSTSFVYFNNTWGQSALINAQEFTALLHQQN